MSKILTDYIFHFHSLHPHCSTKHLELDWAGTGEAEEKAEAPLTSEYGGVQEHAHGINPNDQILLVQPYLQLNVASYSRILIGSFLFPLFHSIAIPSYDI